MQQGEALRRVVLALAGGAAGCSESADDTPTLSPSPTATATPTRSPTDSPTATPSPTPTEADTARAFVRDLAADEHERAHGHLAAVAANQLSVDTLHRLWLGLTAQHGEFEEIAGVERTTANGSPVAVVTARCAEADQPVRYAFDVAGAIAGLLFPARYAPPAYADESASTERCEDPPSRSSRRRSHVSDGSLDRCGQFPPPAIGRSGPRILLPAPALWLAR